MYRSIVIAYDGSDDARGTFARAAELAGRDNASLTVVEAMSGKVPSPAPGGPPLAKPKKQAMACEDLRRAIEADLIVTGSRARGPITRAVLVSVSSEILHGASCDLLVVHAPE